ncbi:unnamed protein product [Polarella glacialis]|uniref:Uncharacterized protein n=1 Tax=Polarella glacialis TaxID=89957 RepID=A0A813ISH9_POLGL|nr:unnamed protein product [Polarella glacialis]
MVLSLSVLADWAARKGLPGEAVEEEEGVKGVREPTFFEKTLVARGSPDWLWQANNEKALLDCMMADEPDLELAMALLKRPKVNVNYADPEFGLTCCHYACKLGLMELLLLFFQNKAKPAPDKLGNMPEHLAARAGHTDLVRLMMNRVKEAKGNFDKANSFGWTALHYACANGQTQAAKLLAYAKCSIYARDEQGITPAMWAAKNGHASTLHELLEIGFDLEKRDYQGLRVADHAQGNLHMRARFLVSLKVMFFCCCYLLLFVLLIFVDALSDCKDCLRREGVTRL